MELVDVLDALCYYDKRSPYFAQMVSPPHRPGECCFCDNCYVGKHELAVEILRLRNAMEKNCGN